VTNNLAECFNNWIKPFKGLNLDELMDKIRQLVVNKWDVRRTISRKITGIILAHIIKELKEQSRNLDMDVQRCGDSVTEVSVKGGSGFKCVLNLEARTCTCRKWQVSGIPCKHAIVFIATQQRRKGHISAPFVRDMATAGITARMVTLKI
jgi:hypothetical protein